MCDTNLSTEIQFTLDEKSMKIRKIDEVLHHVFQNINDFDCSSETLSAKYSRKFQVFYSNYLMTAMSFLMNTKLRFLPMYLFKLSDNDSTKIKCKFQTKRHLCFRNEEPDEFKYNYF